MAEPLNIPQLVARAITDPRGAFHQVQGLGLDRASMWQILVLFTLGRVLLIGLFDGGRYLIPLGTTPVLVSPFTYTMVLISGFVVMVFLVHYTGRAMGGKGTFKGSLVVALLLEGLALVLVLLQLLLGLFLPALVGIISLLSLPVMLYCALSYIDELHEFGSMLKALGMIVLAVIGLSLGITMFMSLIGAGSGFTGLEGV
ncbi:YIP1 family protein [Flavimaricola marinus]|uniref:Yip1 domain protein n=1 Tax=Flavimaricola marinus TaxID=1819565 RepID=A0A238LDD2_9RHOB|nr:YIP1 family protein [Flavimaricola marinus]SMY07592.1 Yip1 domain protein [Flavimaricola marinus]